MHPDDGTFYGLTAAEQAAVVEVRDTSTQSFYNDSWTADFIDRDFKKEPCTCHGRDVITDTFQDGSHASHYNRAYWQIHRDEIEKFMTAQQLNPTLHARDWGLRTMPQIFTEPCRSLSCVNDRFSKHPFYAGSQACKYPKPLPDCSVLRGTAVWTHEHMRAVQLIRILMTDRATKVSESIKYITTSSLVAKIIQNEVRDQLFAGSFIFIYNNIPGNDNIIGIQMIELLMERINKRISTFIIDPKWSTGSQLSRGMIPALVEQGLVHLL
jgi:hypothetical protein